MCGLTFELTRGQQMAKPAVALRVQRRVRPQPRWIGDAHSTWFLSRSFYRLRDPFQQGLHAHAVLTLLKGAQLLQDDRGQPKHEEHWQI